MLPMKYLAAIALLFLLQTSWGQGVVRLELEAAINSDIYQLVPCAERGVLVFYETRDFMDEEHKSWFFTAYDRNLKEMWKANIAVLNGTAFQDYRLADSLVYLAFLNTGRGRSGSANFQMVTIDLKNGLSFVAKSNLPAESTLEDMCIHNGRAYLALGIRGEEAAIHTLDLKTGTTAVFNVALADENFIEDLAFDEQQDLLLATVSNFVSRRQNKMFLLALSASGEYLYDMEIMPAVTGKYLNTAKIQPLEDGKLMVVGSYGGLAARIPARTEYFGIESAGLFVTRIADRRQEFMNYYNFMEFVNLRAGVSARDFYRLQRKKNREPAEYSLNYELLEHDLVMHDSTFVILVESFYPEFRTVSDVAYDVWGRPVTNTYTVFDGYRFFNAILAGFDAKGNMVWDNSLEISLPPQNVLRRHAAYFFDGDPALIFYNDGYRVSYRVSLKNAELEPFSRLDLETSVSGDRIAQAGYNRMEHWYGHYFLAYGYHTIQNNIRSDRDQRTVFYINKIALE